MNHLIVESGHVINVVLGDRPEGYPFPNHLWIAQEGDAANVQIGWTMAEDGSFQPPPPPPIFEEEPAAE